VPITTLNIIKKLRDQGTFSDFDVHFVELFTKLTSWIEESVLIAIALTSHLTAQGHVCVDLKEYENQPFPLLTAPNQEILSCPPLILWLESLRNCPFVGAPGDYTPFILHEQRLYLYRYWEYEQQVVTFIRDSLQKPPPAIDETLLRENLSTLFPEQTTGIDWQRVAVLTALSTHFCLISGGPGTGKTFTVAKILVSLLTQIPNLRIALAAPTGKAAARLKQVITLALKTFDCPATIKAMIPRETYTLHRLLGSLSHSPYFYYNANNPLPYHVIIVDEASMVDLALMAKLVQAIPPSARWILVGDKDQLASIEVGTVLGDLCEVGTTHWVNDRQTIPKLSRLQDCIVFLEKNYRFSIDSDIGQLAILIKQGYTEQVLHLLKKPRSSTVKWRTFDTDTELLTALHERVVTGFSGYFQAKSPEDTLQALEKFRVLSALRQGHLGVVTLNRLIEQIFVEQGVIQIETHRWYHKQPIMITENDYSLALFNGDVGVILCDSSHQQMLRAFFSTSDGELRTFLPTRLPTHETVYAMTIHKSQGSEFDNVLIVLPQQCSRLLSRELLYTGITRAKQSVELWASEPVLRKVLDQQIQRKSGLYQAFKE